MKHAMLVGACFASVLWLNACGGGPSPATEKAQAVEPTRAATTVPLRVPPTQPPPTATPTERPTATPSTPTPTTMPFPGTPSLVISVTDGDTIVVEIDGVTYPLRYIGMDTPERAGEWLAAEATDANRALVEGETVYLEKDTSEVDVYDRLLRYVYLADGTFVNAELVRLGFARAVAYPPDTARQDELIAAEEEAKAGELGLWEATPVPTDPPAPAGTVIRIVNVDKRAEYVDIENQGDAAQDLGGWVLVSEKGDQACPLAGIIGPGEILRIWALAEDAGEGDYNCGMGSPIWNNSEKDPAVLYDSAGQEVSRY